MTRIVVVTGGSSGIGRAVAERFAEAGDDVVITGRHADSLAQAATEIGAKAVRCDSSMPDNVAVLARQLGDRVDVVVNMAGGNTDLDRAAGDDTSLADLAAAWRANLDANLLSTVLTTTELLPAIQAGGAIINVSSIGAEYASTSYGAAKAAVAAWTAGLSSQVGPRGITANTIAPGYIADTGVFGSTLTADRRARLVEATHDKRAGLPADIAATVHFLASPGARHITGQTLHVNGGAHTTR
jgi:3-oxoacyl-[acyl-carrier protein] reductase